jgi:glutaredoxin
MHICVYTKTGCPWRKNVIDFLHKYDLPYEEKNMLENHDFLEECEKKTGQSICPTIDIDGHFLIDSDAEKLEKYLKEIWVL